MMMMPQQQLPAAVQEQQQEEQGSGIWASLATGEGPLSKSHSLLARSSMPQEHAVGKGLECVAEDEREGRGEQDCRAACILPSTRVIHGCRSFLVNYGRAAFMQTELVTPCIQCRLGRDFVGLRSPVACAACRLASAWGWLHAGACADGHVQPSTAQPPPQRPAGTAGRARQGHQPH
jgi:hypothetical protein